MILELMIILGIFAGIFSVFGVICHTKTWERICDWLDRHGF